MHTLGTYFKMSRNFDLIVFGATGLTGKLVVQTILKTLDDPSTETFTWAVAARSASKLEEVLAQVGAQTGKDLKNVVKIIASTADQDSLRSMASLCKVLLNCVGPYMIYGEQVVQACIAEGTHHVDVSGEPQYLEGVQLRYHGEAEEKGVYVVGGCGFNSLPADCGVVHLMQNFEGQINSLDHYVDFSSHGKPIKIHYATWHSIVNRLGQVKQLDDIREKLFPEPLPKPVWKIKDRGNVHHSEVAEGWALPILGGADLAIMTRSQWHFYRQDNKTPIQMQSFMRRKSLPVVLIMVFAGAFIGFMVKFGFGRSLLINHPRLFSFGNVTHDDPTQEEMDGAEYTITLSAQGWSKHDVKEETRSEKPNKTKTLKVKGKDHPARVTCVSLLEAALLILREGDKMPSTGGVYPPGAAFAKTTIIERLGRHGMSFTIAEN